MSACDFALPATRRRSDCTPRGGRSGIDDRAAAGGVLRLEDIQSLVAAMRFQVRMTRTNRERRGFCYLLWRRDGGLVLVSGLRWKYWRPWLPLQMKDGMPLVVVCERDMELETTPCRSFGSAAAIPADMLWDDILSGFRSPESQDALVFFQVEITGARAVPGSALQFWPFGWQKQRLQTYGRRMVRTVRVCLQCSGLPRRRWCFQQARRGPCTCPGSPYTSYFNPLNHPEEPYRTISDLRTCSRALLFVLVFGARILRILRCM